MKTLPFTVALVIITLTSGILARQALDPEVLLKTAMRVEQVDGDLARAIDQYKSIVAKYGDSHAVAARALLQVGVCYEKLGSADSARTAYEQILSRYADALATATTARTRLAAIQGGQGASAIPPFPATHALDFLDPRGDNNYALSPNGAFVVYETARREPSPASVVRADPASRPGGIVRHTLTVRDLTTGQERVVVDIGESTFSFWSGRIWSPDSRRLSFVSEDKAPPGGAARIRLSTAVVATGEIRQIAATENLGSGFKFYFDWSPDGQRLAFTYVAYLSLSADARKLADVRVAAMDAGETKPLGVSSDAPANWAWSPDSRRLALYLTDWKHDSAELRIVDAVTGTATSPRTPAAVPGIRSTCGGPAESCLRLSRWTAKDEIVAWQSVPGSGADYFLIPTDGREPRKICGNRSAGAAVAYPCGSITPDGASMIVTSEGRPTRLMVRDLTTNVDRPLTIGSGEEDAARLSSDGRLVAFTSNRDGNWALYVVPLDRAPVANPLKVASLGKRPDNRGITTNHWTTGGLLAFGFYFQDRDLFRLDLDRTTGKAVSAPVRLNTDNSEKTFPVVSPDSTHLAAWSRNSTRTGIVVMDINGAGERWVLDHPLRPTAGLQPGGSGMPLMWRSPEEIALFEWVGPGNGAGLASLQLNTGALRPVPNADSLVSAAPCSGCYIPSREEVLFGTSRQVGKPGEVKVRSLRDGAERVLATTTSLGSIAVSTDGRLVAYSHLTYTDSVKGKVAAEIRVIGIDGTGDRMLVTATTDIRDYGGSRFSVDAWSPDGALLLYRDTAGLFRVLNVASGNSWPLFDQRPGEWDEVAWAPNGSFLVLRSYAERAEWKAFNGVTYDAVIRLMNTGGLR